MGEAGAGIGGFGGEGPALCRRELARGEGQGEGPLLGHGQAVPGPVDRGEVEDTQQRFVLALSQEGDDRVLGVVHHAPLEAVPAVVPLVEGRVVLVEPVQAPDEPAELLVLGIGEKEPLQALVEPPLDEGAQLRPHEGELSCWNFSS